MLIQKSKRCGKRSISFSHLFDFLSLSQKSDASGKYAYMVYPDTDYYLIVTKDGYVTHTSGPISAGVDIVIYDVELEPTGGKNSGSSGRGGKRTGRCYYTLYFAAGSSGADSTKTGNKQLDGLPKTGDESGFQIFYVMLALAALMVTGISLLESKKKKFNK
ncbi:hypothetical protein [Lacrimispora sp.]|uniref:hypothetical protein n=1 Tax=Lacrimispora sp. TaxID=2719234 RepID=UPI002FD8963A